MRKSLTLEEALRERSRDIVYGTISVTFETSPNGDLTKRMTVTKVETKRPDGRTEIQTITETLERRLVPSGNS